MNEVTEQPKQELSSDINIITAEINAYKQVAGEAIFEIGRRLKHVKENDLAHGEFGKWLESIDMTRDYAGRFIRIYEELGSSNYVSGRNLGIKALYEIAQIPVKEREKEHTLSSGDTKTPSEMTVRELRQLKTDLKKAEERAELERKERERLEKEVDKEPKIKYVTRTEYVEIDNTDYEKVNYLEKQIQSLNRTKELLEDRLSQQEKDNQRAQSLKKQIQDLASQKDDFERQLDSAIGLSSLYTEIEHFINTKLAPVRYSRALSERIDSPVVKDNLSGILSTVEDWCREMRNFLPDESDIIEGDVVFYE